ncbi:MAG: hypothetical protein ACN6OP_15885 [Pseudomonadales bacterium]
MSKLSYLSVEQWARVPMIDYRPRFFVECFTEKLRLQTPHFYQAKLMNVFAASDEVIEYIDSSLDVEKNGVYVQIGAEELFGCWEADVVAQEIFSEFLAVKADLARAIKSSDIDQYSRLKLRGVCKAIVRRKDEYEAILLERLGHALTGEYDASQVERQTVLIERLTGLYVTFLLNQGYSPTYLFNRSKWFTHPSKYGGRDFPGQFEHVTGKLRSRQESFEVYYAMRAARPSYFLGLRDYEGLTFSEGIPDDLSGQEVEKFKRSIMANVIVKAELASTDYISAALFVKELVNKMLDLTAVVDFSHDLVVAPHCMVVGRASPAKTLNVDLLLAFLTSDSGRGVGDYAAQIRTAFDALNPVAQDQIGRSLRYLRLAKESASVEQRLLNLWIALESIFVGVGVNIISGVLEFVPRFYAIHAIEARVEYLKSLLVGNSVAVTSLSRSKLADGLSNFDESVENDDVFRILRDEAAAIELFSSLGAKEHLKYRMRSIFKDVKNNKETLSRVERTRQDVARQLRRIYFVRNKIAHTGHYHGVRTQLATHLLDYISICYRVLVTAATQADQARKYSVSELLVAARMGADLIYAKIGSKDEVSSVSELRINALI